MVEDFNINDYLCDDEKKEIAKRVFEQEMRKKFQNEEEIQRVFTNTAYFDVYKEIAKIVPKYKEIIEKKVEHIILNHDLKHETFHRMTYKYGEPSSPAIDIMDRQIRDMSDVIKEKIIKAVQEFDVSDFVAKAYGRSIYDLSVKYQTIADMFWELRKENAHIEVEKEE